MTSWDAIVTGGVAVLGWVILVEQRISRLLTINDKVEAIDQKVERIEQKVDFILDTKQLL